MIKMKGMKVAVAADNSMVIGGGIFPWFAHGQDGKLRASAVIPKKDVITADKSMVIGGGKRKKMILMAFGAHYDDAEGGVGGILAKHTAREDKAIVVHMVKGNDERQEESNKANKILGTELISLDFEFRNLKIDKESISKVEKLITLYDPDVILTHWPIDRHFDHQQTGILILTIIHQVGKAYRYPVYFYEVCTGAQTLNFYPDYYVDITKYAEQKHKALAQYKAWPQYASYHDLMERFRGQEMRYGRAEALVTLCRMKARDWIEAYSYPREDRETIY